MVIADPGNSGDPVKLFHVTLASRTVSPFVLTPMPMRLKAIGVTGGYFYYVGPGDAKSLDSEIRRAPIPSGNSELVALVPSYFTGQLAESDSDSGFALLGEFAPARLYWYPKGSSTPQELQCLGKNILYVHYAAIHGDVLYALVDVAGDTPNSKRLAVVRRSLR